MSSLTLKYQEWQWTVLPSLEQTEAEQHLEDIDKVNVLNLHHL